jgi:cytochrome c biogenesis protein CcmG, thiol:disulfide interchange protein DsbE
MRRLATVPLLVTLLALAHSVPAEAQKPPKPAKGAPGTLAPDFRLPVMDEGSWRGAGTNKSGERVRLSDLRGQIVVINFWATWCRPCVSEMMALRRIEAKYASRGVALYAVLVQDRAQNAQAFLDLNGLNGLPILIGVASRIQSDYAVRGIPQTFIVGPDGVILDRLIGARTYATFEERIERALATVAADATVSVR